MRKITCLITMLLIAVVTNAQLKQVAGKVAGKATGLPLQGVTVQSGNTVTTTNADGAFALQAKKGDKISFSFTGMKPFTLSVTDVGSSRVDLQACKLEYSIVSPK